LWFLRIPIPKLVMLLEKSARWMVRRLSDFLTRIWWILAIESAADQQVLPPNWLNYKE
jgi:hypothetical protein